MALTDLLPRALLLLGLGFLVANVRVAVDLVRWARRRSEAVLVWRGRTPPFYGLSLGIGVLLGVLILFKLFVQLQPPSRFFGELMMFVYYGYALPLSTRIRRGLYADGIWVDRGFMPYTHIGGLSWREGAPDTTLVVIARDKGTARRLDVPGPLLGEVRRHLREKVTAHDIDFVGAALDLGGHDAREDI
ncbi:MAG: hypothetical protein Q8L86_18505 [Vicinamibacterales bacterium]|nr:hypothetical protein [Vicinamibacterales bacterium]